MLLLKYLKDRYYQTGKRYKILDNFSVDINKEYLQKELIEHIISQFYFTDIDNNTIKIKLDCFDNVWVKITNKEHLLNELRYQIELFTIIEKKEVVFLTNEKINHQLFFELITQKYISSKETNYSNYKSRQSNYKCLHDFVQKSHKLDFSTYESTKVINISANHLTIYMPSGSLKYVPLNNILFFKALENDSLLPVLNNYSIIYDSRNTFLNVHYSKIQEVIENYEQCEIFRRYSITKMHIENINDIDKNESINTILDFTEATLNFPKHKNSYYYEVVENKIKQKDFNVYFMFLRLSFFGKLEMVLQEFINFIDEDMVESFDKLTVGCLEVLKHPDVSSSTFNINEYQKTVEVNIFIPHYENIKGIMYQLLTSLNEKNKINNTTDLSTIIKKLMSSTTFKVLTIPDAIEILEKFSLRYSFYKIKLKHKLDKKLVSKKVVEKINKI